MDDKGVEAMMYHTNTLDMNDGKSRVKVNCFMRNFDDNRNYIRIDAEIKVSGKNRLFAAQDAFFRRTLKTDLFEFDNHFIKRYDLSGYNAWFAMRMVVTHECHKDEFGWVDKECIFALDNNADITTKTNEMLFQKISEFMNEIAEEIRYT